MTSTATSESTSATSSTWVTGQGWVGDSNTYPSQAEAGDYIIVARARWELAKVECAYRARRIPHKAETSAARAALLRFWGSCIRQKPPIDDNTTTIYRRCCRIIVFLKRREKPFQDELELATTLEAYIAPPADAETS